MNLLKKQETIAVEHRISEGFDLNSWTQYLWLLDIYSSIRVSLDSIALLAETERDSLQWRKRLESLFQIAQAIICDALKTVQFGYSHWLHDLLGKVQSYFL